MWACACNRQQRGLADVLVSLQVHLRSAERLRKLCCANRGTFIKVGQHLGALDYLLPEEYTRTLKVLHSQAPQSTRQEIEQVIREDLGKEVRAAIAHVGFLGLSKPWKKEPRRSLVVLSCKRYQGEISPPCLWENVIRIFPGHYWALWALLASLGKEKITED